jgi:predicted DNA-binding protein
MPRPRRNTDLIWVSLSEKTKESLRQISTRQNKSMSEYVRILIEDDIWAEEYVTYMEDKNERDE